jgi:dienelactone hydrolase
MTRAISTVSTLHVFLVLFLLATPGQFASAQNRATDEWLTTPVGDLTFDTYVEFFGYDDDVSLDATVFDVVNEEGLRRENISFVTTPGVRATAEYYTPIGASGKALPSIILLHGGAPGGKSSAHVRTTATILARAGWAVLAIDLLYFGERATDRLVTYREQEKHERLYNQKSVYLAWIIQAVKDVSRSFDYLVDERGADPGKIALYGFSRGAQVASIAGAVERRLAAVVLVHGGHFDRFETGHLPAACPANYIGRISPRPLFTLNGTQDMDLFRDSSVLPLLRHAKPPHKQVWAETGHGVVEEKDRASIVQWLRENVQ